MIGRQLGAYRVVAQLGEGGMGTVYRAVDEAAERQVALKVLRTRLEAVALARLHHPGIPTLYSLFAEDGALYMAMEYVPGSSLEDRLREHGALPWPEATRYLVEALDAVRHAHEQGILHRDLKPANLLLTPEGRVKVTDFGIAEAVGREGSATEVGLAGTPEYLAPERAVGRPADERSDLYSLGVVLYEMLTGRLPFVAESDFALLRAQAEEAPVWPAELGIALPPGLDQALRRALAKDPADRFPDAAAFAATLGCYAEPDDPQ